MPVLPNSSDSNLQSPTIFIFIEIFIRKMEGLVMIEWCCQLINLTKAGNRWDL